MKAFLQINYSIPKSRKQDFSRVGERFFYHNQDIKVRGLEDGMRKRYYIKLSCKIKDRIEVEKHYDLRYGAPGMPREKRHRKTPEEMARQNLWRKQRDLRRLIELNFGPGDWHVVLTCRKEERPSKEEAPKVIREFWDKLRSAYRRRGWELKVIITCETGERGAVHWHMIVNDVHDGKDSTAALIRKLWIRGRPYFSPMDDSGDYKKLAEYIIKETADRIKKENTAEKLSYMCSRNLARPRVDRKKVDANGWRMEPKAPEGWELVKGSLVNGKNKYTGLPYQYYTMRKLKKEEKDADGRNLYRDKRKRSRKRHGPGDVPDEDYVKKRKRAREHTGGGGV